MSEYCSPHSQELRMCRLWQDAALLQRAAEMRERYGAVKLDQAEVAARLAALDQVLRERGFPGVWS